MKWRHTIGPVAGLMYQLPAFCGSGWHLWKLKTARALFIDELSDSAGWAQTHICVQTFPIHGIHIPMKPLHQIYFKTWMKSKWNLNMLVRPYISLVPCVDCKRSVEGSQQGNPRNVGAVCNLMWATANFSYLQFAACCYTSTATFSLHWENTTISL